MPPLPWMPGAGAPFAYPSARHCYHRASGSSRAWTSTTRKISDSP